LRKIKRAKAQKQGEKMFSYDSKKIQTYALTLTTIATIILIFNCLLFMVVGGIIGKSIGRGFMDFDDYQLPGIGIGLIAGFIVGYLQSFLIKLLAQISLAITKIEENTKPKEPLS
jgi:hypothetical protein